MSNRFIAVRGAYVGTTDNRIDRWYVDDTESDVIDRRSRGFATKAEAKKQAAYLEMVHED